MKLFLTNCLFLFLIAVAIKTKEVAPEAADESTTAKTTPGPVTKTLAICPTDAELTKVGCLCYSESQYLICDGSSGFFDFKQRYIFKTVVIRNSPKLPFWSEHITKKDDFVVESLIILQGNDDVEVAENFEELLQMPTKSFKIVTNGQIKRLNLYKIQSNLTSISVTGVPQLAHRGFSPFNFGEESTLEHLQLRSVIFDPVIETFVLSGLPLKMLEITKSNLKGLVSVVPSKCPPENERIVIDLRSNTEMTGFEFSSLFKTTFDSKTCHYHIDLSDNPKLNTNILINNIPTLKDHGANMFIRIAGVDLECNCDLINLYKDKLKNNIHSVQCKGNGFLDEIANDLEKIKKFCAPPTTTTAKKVSPKP